MLDVSVRPSRDSYEYRGMRLTDILDRLFECFQSAVFPEYYPLAETHRRPCRYRSYRAYRLDNSLAQSLPRKAAERLVLEDQRSVNV
jgi:hypothetical protein